MFEYEVTLENAASAGDAIGSRRLQAWNAQEAIDKLLRIMFGFRSRHLPKAKAVVRIGRHGRVREILKRDVKAVAELQDTDGN